MMFSNRPAPSLRTVLMVNSGGGILDEALAPSFTSRGIEVIVVRHWDQVRQYADLVRPHMITLSIGKSAAQDVKILESRKDDPAFARMLIVALLDTDIILRGRYRPRA